MLVLRVSDREIELVHKLSKGGAVASSASLERGSLVGLTELTTRQPFKEDSWDNGGSFEPQPEELTEEDQIVLQRWKERDKQFDAQVAHIGDAIDRIGERRRFFVKAAEKCHSIRETVISSRLFSIRLFSLPAVPRFLCLCISLSLLHAVGGVNYA